MDSKSSVFEKNDNDIQNYKIKSYIIRSSDKASDPIEILSNELKIKKSGIEITKDNQSIKKIHFNE